MKKIIIVLFLILFVFSGCAYQYTHNDVAEMKDKWDEEYYEMEEKYSKAYDDYINLDVAIARSYDEAVVVKAYFLGWDESSFEDAKKSFKKMYDYLYPGEW